MNTEVRQWTAGRAGDAERRCWRGSACGELWHDRMATGGLNWSRGDLAAVRKVERVDPNALKS